MKKLSLYIFLVLMWCNVGFANDKDKITFDRCNGEKNKNVDDSKKKQIGYIEFSYEINLKTKSVFFIVKRIDSIIEGKIHKKIIKKIYISHPPGEGVQIHKPFISIAKCCDRPTYKFNIRTGEIIITAGWTGEKTIIMCEIID